MNPTETKLINEINQLKGFIEIQRKDIEFWQGQYSEQSKQLLSMSELLGNNENPTGKQPKKPTHLKVIK